MLDEIKTSNPSTIGKKLSKYLIVKPVILIKYKLRYLGFKWIDQLSEKLHQLILKNYI